MYAIIYKYMYAYSAIYTSACTIHEVLDMLVYVPTITPYMYAETYTYLIYTKTQ